MADERTCYAGDLGSDVLGKTIRTDGHLVEVEAVRHSRFGGVKMTTVTGAGGDVFFNADETVQVLP